MKKLIYAVKRGRKTGIFDNWKDKCDLQIDGFSGALFHGFPYKTQLAEADENTEGSLRYAFKLAEQYMSNVDVGGFQLVYQGRKKDYVEEERWKKEGFLPFGKETFEKSKYDHTKEKEVYSKIQVSEESEDYSQNEPWLEILLTVVEEEASKFKRQCYARVYVGRYDVPTLYTALITFVLEPELILESFAEICMHKGIINNPSMRPNEWVNEACEVWKDSDEYRDLKLHFERNGMEGRDIDELLKRCGAFAIKSFERILKTNSAAYIQMKEYINQGGHALSDLYWELINNSVYSNEIVKVSGPFANPDLKRAVYKEGATASLKQMVLHAESISVKLKENVIGQDDAIDKLEKAFFHAEKNAYSGGKKKGPRNVFLFAGPPGVGKTFTAQLFADELGLPFRRFDMSGYPREDSVEELAGISTFWKSSKPGVLTDYVMENPHCVLLFDEIEKAHGTVIKLFLQILDEGLCYDRHHDTNISFKDTIIIFTTNAGKQRYTDAKDENLTALTDKQVLDALAKDINPQTHNPYFPPEIISRMSSYTVIMFNHLKADALRRVVEKDVENQLIKTEKEFGYNLTVGKSELAKTVLYSMGGSADARNASQLAGKLIDQQLLEFMNLMMEKRPSDNIENLKQIEWKCDFTETTDEVRELYFGETNCVIPVLGDMKATLPGIFKEKGITVEDTTDPDVFREIFRSGKVLFAVIDYTLGLDNTEDSLNIADSRTVGSKVFLDVIEEDQNISIYVLCGGKSEYEYSDREKNDLIKKGVRGFIDREIYEDALETVYWDVCCQKVMDTLARRHQVLTYKTRKGFVDKRNDIGKIEFYDLKLETAVESEDESSILSNVERPDVKFNDVIGAEEAKKELQYFVKYLMKPRKFLMNGNRPPKGVLLYGPPGTGKTMLARAMAGESDVAFFPTSATEFKNKYVGESEANIRRIFARAKKYAPAIIFIDEIDAIGKKRTGSNATTESMLNALLTEMDGFGGTDKNKPVFVLAATNYGVGGANDEIASLDEALLRRFDNRIYVGLPKEEEREQYILKMLADRKITTISGEADAVRKMVERTGGQSLADLQNIFEQACRKAGRQERVVEEADLLKALEEFYTLPTDVERPDVKFNDVIGAEDAKEELQYFVKYLTKPEEFLMNGDRPPKGVLLYGPPGTGKTMLAKAMAGESSVAFFPTSATEFGAPHVGESEANIRRIFAKAKKYAPAIIFIDEIDAIGKKRTGSGNTHHTESMLNALLTEMDGFSGADKNKPVFVLAATNYLVRREQGGIASLDEALLRRFDNKIYVDLPKEKEREQYILKMLDDRKIEITTVFKDVAHNIAVRTTGQSLADIQNVIELAFRNAGRQERIVTRDDLLTALDDYNHGEKKECNQNYYKQVAIHETGHAYVAYKSGEKPPYITIESRGNHLGYMQHANQENSPNPTKEDLLARIRISLAGRAAEQVFYGKEASLNTGASSDLQKATNLAFHIVCTFGMEDDQLIILTKEEVLQSALAGEYTAKVNEILKTEMKNTLKIIEEGKEKIQEIVDVLLKENRMTGEKFEELMEETKKA